MTHTERQTHGILKMLYLLVLHASVVGVIAVSKWTHQRPPARSFGSSLRLQADETAITSMLSCHATVATHW